MMRLLEQHEQLKVDSFKENGGLIAKYIKELNLGNSLGKYYKSLETFEPFKIETRFNSIFGVECLYGEMFSPFFCINDFDLGYTVPLNCYITDFCERLATQELFLKYKYHDNIGCVSDLPSSSQLSFLISRPIKDDIFKANKDFNVVQVHFKQNRLTHIINPNRPNLVYNKYEFKQPEFHVIKEENFKGHLIDVLMLEGVMS